MPSLEKALFWEKPIQQISRRIARALPFMSNTSVTQNVAERLNTTQEGAHLAMIWFLFVRVPFIFKLALTPLAIIELVRAYKKTESIDCTEIGKAYLKYRAEQQKPKITP